MAYFQVHKARRSSASLEHMVGMGWWGNFSQITEWALAFYAVANFRW